MITGHGRYVDDLNKPGMVHAAFVRSTVARGRIVEPGRQRGPPGAGRDRGAHRGRGQPRVHAFGRTCPAGARTRLPGGCWPTATCGTSVSRSSWSSPSRAIWPRTPPSWSAWRSSPMPRSSPWPRRWPRAARWCTRSGRTTWPASSRPRTAPSWTRSSRTRRTCSPRPSTQHRYVGVPMETRGLVAEWDRWAGQLDVIFACQGVHVPRAFFSRMLGIPEDDVRVVMNDVGGVVRAEGFPAAGGPGRRGGRGHPR